MLETDEATLTWLLEYMCTCECVCECVGVGVGVHAPNNSEGNIKLVTTSWRRYINTPIYSS